LHARSVQVQRAKVRNNSLTPSARILADIMSHGRDWSQFVADHSNRHASRFKKRPLPSYRMTTLAGLAEQSISQQRELEAQEQVPFEQYLASYFDQYRVIPSPGLKREPAGQAATA
jgi:glutamate--cysteine ligase